MIKKFIVSLMAIIAIIGLVVAGCATTIVDDEEPRPPEEVHAIMYFDIETLRQILRPAGVVGAASCESGIAGAVKPLSQGSHSVLPLLDYIPEERHQGWCGNCWVWTGTGILEIALNVQEGIRDRLSIQYFNSCWPGNVRSRWACCGGFLSWFADFYHSEGLCVPWSNTNAHYQDFYKTCEDQGSDVPCDSIGTSPRYPIEFVEQAYVNPLGVSSQQSQAIENIKDVLHQDMAIGFAYWLTDSDAWGDFADFWYYGSETDIWDPSDYSGRTWVHGQGGGHYVLCVGYSDEHDDRDNHYWIMLNSWGTGIDDNRPNGLFRMKMDIDYDAALYLPGYDEPYLMFDWEILNVAFGPRYNLSVTSTNGGSVTDPGEGQFQYWVGEGVDLVAAAEEGYQFVNWTGDVATIANVDAASTTITMNGDYSITANFGLDEEEAVYFACPNLEAAIREAVGIPHRAIYPSDLEGLTDLDARDRSIADLTGLEYCIDLTRLILSGNQISDVAALEGLTLLDTLSLSNNQISDISPLQGLTSLTHLFLSDNQPSDISPLQGLANLTVLGLMRTQLRDISPLQGLTSLNRLDLWHNQISDISPLQGLINLTVLGFGDNQISDISPLQGLTSLNRLDLCHNQISDIAPLQGLTSLISLHSSRNQISDIAPLQGLTNLTALELHSNQIVDISPLQGLTSLTRLYLTNNQISDISPLEGLTSLTSLEVSDNQVSDISPLQGLTSLTTLYLYRNQISDISPLEGLTNLEHLYLWENEISDISPLEGLTNLTFLYLGDNQISDILPLEGLTNLTRLHLYSNQISDIYPLVENQGLGEGDYVDLRNNPLSEESINEYIPELKARGVAVDY